jgi:hypothetical protein
MRSTDTEKAYRRGVHQAIHMIDSLIHEDRFLKVDPASVLDIADAFSKTIRYDTDPHPYLVDDLKAAIIRQLEETGLVE